MTAAGTNQSGGDVVPLDKGNAPSDLHDVIGLRLPEELYHYLSRGMIQPQTLNTLTSGTCYVTMPTAGSDSESYRTLVQTQLDPIRRQTISLLAEPLNRYFQVKEITTRLWFDRDSEIKFNSKTVQPSPRETLAKWHVKDSLLQEVNIRPICPSHEERALIEADLDQGFGARISFLCRRKLGYPWLCQEDSNA